jgi:raffinose/stachyose/melibiose transport system permease protein
MTKTRHILTSVLMVPLAALMAVPFYYIVVNTFKTQEETTNHPLALPTEWVFDNYANVFEGTEILQSLLNTIYVTAASILLMLAIGSLAAFGRITGRGQATLIPLYRMLVGVELVDSLNGLILLYAAGSIFCYYLILGYMRTIPAEIIEAARIDGAGPLRIYWTIVLPLIRPILVTVGVFQTMWVWNDFITPNVFISSEDKQTLVLQVYSAVGQFTTDWPAFMTLTVIVLVPMVIFFILMQRHIVSGLVNGSVKG